MKKFVLFLLLTIMACGAVRSQTNLYKQMTKVHGVTASCIENYPIGDSVRVSVTMLEASDTAIYDNMVRMMKEKVEIQDTALWARMARRMLRLATLSDQRETRSPQTILDRFPPVRTMTLKIFGGQMNTETANLCQAYCVKEWQTILVFHCHDEAELEQVVNHTYSLILGSVESLRN